MGVGKRNGGIRRLYSPSGPWVDAAGNPAPSPNASTSSEPTKPAKKKRRSSWPNPDPANYKIVEAQEVGKCLVLKIHYPDCDNFEGKKILVFRGVTLVDIINLLTT